jgi:hypothetical protein
MNDFHFPTQQAADVMSKLVVATGASTATFQEFTGALHSVEPAAAAAGIKYEDLLATISQGTKSGASADQVTENIRNAISALSGAQGPARDAMRQIGIDADDVSQHLSQRGLAGSFQYLADTIKSKMDPNNLIPTGVFKQSAGELDALTNSLQAMSPAAAAVAEGYRNGSVTAKQFRSAVMGSSGEDTKRLQDFKKWADDLNDFSTRYKNGQSTLVTYNEELRKVTGTVAGQSIALQVTGENADATNALIAKLNGTTREHDGTVKGFNETQETLNAKLRDAKAAFGAAAIELGEAFIPAIKEAADGIKATAEFLAAHQDAVRDAVIVVGALGTAWAVTKTAMAIGSLVSSIGTGMATIGGFVMGLTGRYQALAGAATEAAAAEQAAAGGGFGKGAAAGAAFRGSGALAAGAAAAPLVATSWGFLSVADDIYANASPEDRSGADAARGRGLAGLARGGGTGTLPSGAISQGPGAQAARRGRSNIPGMGIATAFVPDNAAGGAIPALREDPANLFDPGAPGGLAPSDAAGKKPPKGDKDDPIWIKPGDPADFKNGDEDHGVTGSSIIKGGFDFSPKSIGTFFTALLTDLALGNPIGKTLAAKRGESKDAPLYVTNVDVQNAQDRLTKAIRDNGPDSAEAKHAAEQLAGTQAAVGTSGGYFDPATGGISARDPKAAAGIVPGGKGAEGWRDTVAATVAKYAPQLGIPADKQAAWTNAIVSQIGTESHGDANADNPNDSNGQGGRQHVSGLLQYLPSSYANSGGKLTGLPYMDPVGQIAGALFASQNPDGSPAGIGHGVGWGPVSKPIVAAPAAPAATGLFGGGSGGPGGIYDPTQILGGGGESPALPSNGGGGFGIGGGASRGPSSATWQPSQYTGRASGYIGGAATRGPRPQSGIPGMNVALGGAGSSTGGAGRGAASAAAPAPRSWGSGKGATSSVGSSILAAAGPLAAMAPGSAQAAQLIDRTIGYVGQVGGIAVEGLMQSLIPTGGGGGIGDPSHSLIGKLAGGIAGAHKSAPNTAGTAAPPGPKAPDDPMKMGNGAAGGDTTHVGSQNNGTQIFGDAHITTPSPQAFASDKPENQHPYATR